MINSRVDRNLSQSVWPKQNKVENIELQNEDCLIVCGGFEDRAMSVINMASESQCDDLTVLNFDYAPPLPSNHFEDISRLCKELGWKNKRIEYDRCNPSGVFETVAEQLPPNINKLYIDISGMSRLLIVQLIVGMLRDETFNIDVSILYTEAELYPPLESETLQTVSNDLSFLSTGVYDIAIVPELSSLTLSRAPTRLIAFPSFNPAQLVSTKLIIQPVNVTLIHGVPAEPSMGWRVDAICKVNQIDPGPKNQSIKVSTLDYSECLKALLKIYDEYAEYNNLVLSPTGSKMQSVAVGVFRGFVRDVQIVYPTPLRFTDPKKHTEGCKQVYELDLTPFLALRNAT